MNTRIFYRYRDAANYKIFSQVVVAGVFSEEAYQQILASLASCPEQGFIPGLIGLPVLWALPGDDALDHPWHEWEGIENTEDTPTLDLSANDVTCAFNQIKITGWDALDAPPLKWEAG